MSDWVEVDFKRLVRRTERAICVSAEWGQQWLPKSAIRQTFWDGRVLTVSVARWFADRELGR